MFGTRHTFVLFQAIRMISGALLFISSNFAFTAVCLFVLLVTCAFTNLRACFGGDGSDQMGVVVAFGALLMSIGLATGDQYVAYSGVAFIGGQALLAYFVAGASKLTSSVWRSGSAVAGVMQTVTFGNPWAARLMLGAPLISFGVGWFVMVTEVLFPIAFVAPPLILSVMLVGFTIFHLSNAIFMGLNSFVLSFLATYPAVWLINTHIRIYLGL